MKIIAIDIGGTEIKGALFDEKVLKKYSRPTDLSGGLSTILASLFEVIDELWTFGVKAISVVSAGTIDSKEKKVIATLGAMPGWVGCPLGDVLQERYNVPVWLENDANGAMIAEMEEHVANGIQNAVMITLGTGVGTAAYIHGVLYAGSTYKVEFGHMTLHPEGRMCSCGNKGCAEQYVSGSALMKGAIRYVDPSIRHGSEIFDHAAKGSLEALKLIDAYIADLTLFLHSINRVLDPEVFIIGGGVIKSQEHFWEKLIHSLKSVGMDKPVLPAKHGNFAGILGAYLNALKELN